MSNDIEELVEHLEELESHATAGPWKRQGRPEDYPHIWAESWGMLGHLDHGDGAVADVDLICAMRNALPSLIADWRSLRAERGRLAKALVESVDMSELVKCQRLARRILSQYTKGEQDGE